MVDLIKISLDKQYLNSKNIVVVEPNFPPSVIPYYILLTELDGKITIKNEYLPKNEEIVKYQTSENLKFVYGQNSGRIYEIYSIKPLKKEDLINSIIHYSKQILIKKTDIRFTDNFIITIEIIKKSIKKSDLVFK